MLQGRHEERGSSGQVFTMQWDQGSNLMILSRVAELLTVGLNLKIKEGFESVIFKFEPAVGSLNSLNSVSDLNNREK